MSLISRQPNMCTKSSSGSDSRSSPRDMLAADFDWSDFGYCYGSYLHRNLARAQRYLYGHGCHDRSITVCGGSTCLPSNSRSNVARAAASRQLHERFCTSSHPLGRHDALQRHGSQMRSMTQRTCSTACNRYKYRHQFAKMVSNIALMRQFI